MIIITPSFSLSFVFKNNVLRGSHKQKAGVLNSSSLKSVFEKLRFRDGLECTQGLTGEKKFSFNFLRPMGRGSN